MDVVNNVGIKESLEFLGGVSILSNTAGKVFADDKVDMSDTAHLLPLALKVKELQAAFTGLGLTKAEILNLSKEELLQLVVAGYEVVEEFSKGKQGL